jgi:ribosomal protein S18 acetylase RimI-like enzyme
MKIKQATPSDVQAIVNMERKLLQYHALKNKYFKPAPDAEEKFEKYLRGLIGEKDAAVFVAQENGKLVGYLVARVLEDPPVLKIRRKGVITDIFVERGYRKRGIGQKLTERALKWFRKQNLQFAELSVYVKNTSGKIFWKQMGFENHMAIMRKEL